LNGFRLSPSNFEASFAAPEAAGSAGPPPGVLLLRNLLRSRRTPGLTMSHRFQQKPQVLSRSVRISRLDHLEDASLLGLLSLERPLRAGVLINDHRVADGGTAAARIATTTGLLQKRYRAGLLCDRGVGLARLLLAFL
jgi:hypothetical protein